MLARQVMYGPTFESSNQIEWDELVAELTAAALDYLRGAGATVATRRSTGRESRVARGAYARSAAIAGA